MHPSILLGDHRPDIIREETLADIFRNTASQYPDKIAYTFQEISITYQDLDLWNSEVWCNIRAIGYRNATGSSDYSS
jgi:non-ribosomal peptide synthetase component E (peptide arylation enzyme)